MNYPKYTPNELMVAQRVARQAHKAQLDMILQTAGRAMTVEELAVHAHFKDIEARALARLSHQTAVCQTVIPTLTEVAHV
jgi:hypothetical protein